MDEKTLQLAMDYLDKLGAKIGQTAETIWPWFVKQQYVEAWYFMSVGIAFVIALIFYGMFVVRKWEVWEEKDLEGLCVATSIFGIIAVVVGMILLTNGLMELADIFNPEYAAMKDLLGMVK